MTDASSAPDLPAALSTVVASLASEPVGLKVALGLVVALVLLMIVDGLRANLVRKKPQGITILRDPHVRATPYAAKAEVPRARPRRDQKGPSKFSAPRPQIRRLPPVAYDRGPSRTPSAGPDAPL
jgi:hypothetical protein